jgi:hypothetical protein
MTTEITFAYKDLSPTAQRKAREDYTSGDYPEYDWWDNTFEDAITMGKKLGIEIGTKTHKNSRGKTYHEPMLYFSGFSSQGDGACFSGMYYYAPDAIKDIEKETNDEELLRIAQELTLANLTLRLQGMKLSRATITTRGNYSHSGTMEVETIIEECEDDTDQSALDDNITGLMRDFADWIYKQLSAENDYYWSDEYVEERLADESFDEEGNVI